MNEDSAACIHLEPSWKRELVHAFSMDYMFRLRAFLKSEIEAGYKIYPQPSNWFSAFAYTPFDRVKVVILGQDPYHGPGQAHGLSFSVPDNVPAPPSLQNIFNELEADLGHRNPARSCLQKWARQGVLLLNSVLTVRDGQAGSHQNQGWEEFTDEVIHVLNEQREHLVFILWGSYAQKKGRLVDRNKHLVLESAHPSPLSAARGFIGSRPFSKCNDYLASHGEKPIDWSL